MLRRFTPLGLVALAVWLAGGCVDYPGLHSGGDGFAEDGDGGGGDEPAPADSDDGGRPDAGDGGDLPTCDLVPQPISLGVVGRSVVECPEDTAACAARVIYRDQSAVGEELWLQLLESGEVIELSVGLPAGSRVPVELGQRLVVSLLVQDHWWREIVLQLTGEQVDGVFSFLQAATRFYDVQTRCALAPDPCGAIVYPVQYWYDPDGAQVAVEQGFSGWVGAGNPHRLLIGYQYQHVEMTCDDAPESWWQYALLGRGVSPCPCRVDFDCAPDFVCDPTVGRCRPDPCAVMDCPAGEVCDPFRGACVRRPGLACARDADCGSGFVCNPATGACVEDWCALVDCAPCSPLQGRCTGCQHDCDCAAGICDLAQEVCVPGCVAEKVSLRQTNPEGYEIAFVCLDGRLPDPLRLLNRVAPGFHCGVTHPGAGCDFATEVACATELQLGPDGWVIDPAQWERLCALSRLPPVTRLTGGYYLP